MIPPQREGQDWSVRYDWQSDNLGAATQALAWRELKGGKIEVPIEFDNGLTPGIKGALRFIISPWND